MVDQKKVEQELGSLVALKDMVRSYSELSSIRIKRSRDQVLYNRRYLESMGAVFEEVRRSYANEVRGILSRRLRRKSGGITFLPHNGRNVAVFLSANTKLYGEMMNETFELFLKDVLEAKSEAVVVGKLGERMIVAATSRGFPYTYFDFPDSVEDRDAELKLVAHLVPYEEIHLYYGKYVNTGAPRASSFSMSSKIEKEDDKLKASQTYIFEPSLEEILKYFEKEIFGNLFDQTIREWQLGKFASRLITMNKVEMKIGERISQVKLEKQRVAHRTANTKQLNMINSLIGRI